MGISNWLEIACRAIFAARYRLLAFIYNVRQKKVCYGTDGEKSDFAFETEKIKELKNMQKIKKMLFAALAVTTSAMLAVGVSACKDEVVDDPLVTETLGYALAEDGQSAYVSEYYAWSSKAEILSTYNGVPVTAIGGEAFQHGEWNLTEIIIPDSVTEIGSALSYCRALKNIVVAENNAKYKSVDGNLYSKDGTELVRYASGKQATEFTIPDGVTSIEIGAFYGGSSLTNIEIPDGVTNIGDWAFDYCSGLTSIALPDGVTSIGELVFQGCTDLASVEIPSTVTSIGDSAFNCCSSLTSIALPDGVTSIGGSAFEGCSSLTSVEIPDGVTSIDYFVFAACSSLISVKIPDGVTSIGDRAFEGCSSLTSVVIPDSVTSIDNAFVGCDGLEEITLPFIGYGENDSRFCASLGGIFAPYGEEDYAKCVPLSLKKVILTSGEAIAEDAFKGCSGLTCIELPESVTTIDEKAFCGCTGLSSITVSENNKKYKSVDGNLYSSGGKNLIQYAVGKTDESFTVPDGVEAIYPHAFDGCAALSILQMSDTVKEIDYNAFANCENLTSVYVPKSLLAIGTDAFEGCVNLENIYITDLTAWCGVKWLGQLMRDGDDVKAKKIYLNEELITELKIPDKVKSIAASAFRNCADLTSVEISAKVTSIGSSAFAFCVGIETITIPDNVQYIGENAFEACSGLKSIVIGSGVKDIGQMAFSGCENLEAVYYHGTESEWEKMNSNCSDITDVARYYYSEKKPTESGDYWHYVNGVATKW